MAQQVSSYCGRRYSAPLEVYRGSPEVPLHKICRSSVVSEIVFSIESGGQNEVVE